jgi:PTH1 family peptidyl-tRNA hydrolase
VKYVIGLGNPGTKYRSTRHNIGFLAAEALASETGATLVGDTDLYQCYRTFYGINDLNIGFPSTYMNNCGEAVAEIVRTYNVHPDDLMVIVDDFQIPFGTIRIRSHGSDGGHNGLSSIIDHLQTDQFPRMRMGIGGVTMPEEHTHDGMARYVLGRFEKSEEGFLPKFLTLSVDAVKCWNNEGVVTAMSLFNRNFYTPANNSG